MNGRALVFEPEKCTGCEACSLACSLSKSAVCAPFGGAIRLRKRFPGRVEGLAVCRQCEAASCEAACPANAFRVLGGIRSIDAAVCAGCGLCVDACPHDGVRLRDLAAGGSVAAKCDLCGGEPRCVPYCATGALTLKDREGMAECASE